MHLIFLENDTDAVQIAFKTGLDILDFASAKIDHSYDHRIATVNSCKNLIIRFCIRVDGPLLVKQTTVIQKTNLDYIYVTVNQPTEKIQNILFSKVPVIQIMCNLII